MEFVGSTSDGDATLSSGGSVALPAGIAEGDLLVLVVTNALNEDPSSLPSGYTLWGSGANGTGGNTFDSRMHVYTKAVGASEQAPAWTFTSTTRWTAHLLAYRGADTADPFAGFGFTSFGASSTTHSGPVVSNVDAVADAWAFHAATSRGHSVGPVSYTPAAGLTEREDLDPGGTSTGRVVSFAADSAAGLGSTADVQYDVILDNATGNGVIFTALLKPGETGPAPVEETFAPDAILAATGLSGTVSAVQDDPASPDGSWLVNP